MKKFTHSILNRSSEEPFIFREAGICDSCGGCGPFVYKPIINPILARQWGLSDLQRKSMSARESMNCSFCGCSYRLRLLARAINYWAIGDSEVSLLQNIDKGFFKNYVIAEINSCGMLHEIIKSIPGLRYSEYGSIGSNIPNEDLQKLSYDNASLDLILTSDVLEHIPDVSKALQETYRVLKPGGAYIMTVPLLMDRKTKRRAHLSKGEIVNDTEPSFHGSGEPDYLVWSEFGFDFIDEVTDVGFDAYYLFLNSEDENDLSGVVLAFKPKDKSDNRLRFKAKDMLQNNLDCQWQAGRVSRLINTIELTNNHVQNLENIINSYKQEDKTTVKTTRSNLLRKVIKKCRMTKTK